MNAIAEVEWDSTRWWNDCSCASGMGIGSTAKRMPYRQRNGSRCEAAMVFVALPQALPVPDAERAGAAGALGYAPRKLFLKNCRI